MMDVITLITVLITVLLTLLGLVYIFHITEDWDEPTLDFFIERFALL